MVQNIPESPRAAIVRDPADAAACQELIRRLGDAESVYRWFCRLALLLNGAVLGVEGDVLRRAMLSTKAIGIDALRRSIGSVEFRDPARCLPALFFAAALVATKRIDIDGPPVRFPAGADTFRKVVTLPMRDLEPASPQEAFTLSVLRHYVLLILREAGFTGDARRMAGVLSEFHRRTRQRFHGDGARIFSWRWTFAIGHMAIAAFLIKGRDAGVLDPGPSRIWDGQMANSELRSRLLALSPAVELVPSGTMFAENFGAYLRERIDGRSVGLFEACGIVADRAGDARGAIMQPPAPDDPVLARFYAESGLSPCDRIVTLHCREAGFRSDRLQDLRNVDIASYLPAIRALAARGYRVVRLGDPTMTPLPAIDNMLDYALSPLKSEALDVLLPAVARFHIGCGSGLSKVPMLFGTPCLFLNWHNWDLLPWGRRNWTVLKPITRLADGRRLADWRSYAGPGRLHSRPILNASGHDIGALTADEIERAVLDYAATVEAEHPELTRTGRNIGRVVLADNVGNFVDIVPNLLSADS